MKPSRKVRAWMRRAEARRGTARFGALMFQVIGVSAAPSGWMRRCNRAGFRYEDGRWVSHRVKTVMVTFRVILVDNCSEALGRMKAALAALPGPR
jgi:hypothetical protein